jgi:hypothetical protein
MKVHRILRLVALALAVAALAAPATAGAHPATRDAQPADRVVIEPDPAPVVQSIDQGFDWASAAIGAGVAGALILLISFGGVTYRHRHEHIGVAH